MEKPSFDSKNYRDNLAKDLKEIRKDDPEKAQEYLEYAKKYHRDYLGRKDLKLLKRKMNESELEKIPKLVFEYLEAESADQYGVTGKYFSIYTHSKPVDAGFGRGTYRYHKLEIRQDKKTIFEIPYQLVGRNNLADGKAGEYYGEKCILGEKILEETPDKLIYGFQDGNGILKIFEFSTKDNLNKNIETFDIHVFMKIRDQHENNQG